MVAPLLLVVNAGQPITTILNFTFPPNPYILCLFSSFRQQFRLLFNGDFLRCYTYRSRISQAKGLRGKIKPSQADLERARRQEEGMGISTVGFTLRVR